MFAIFTLLLISGLTSVLVCIHVRHQRKWLEIGKSIFAAHRLDGLASSILAFRLVCGALNQPHRRRLIRHIGQNTNVPDGVPQIQASLRRKHLLRLAKFDRPTADDRKKIRRILWAQRPDWLQAIESRNTDAAQRLLESTSPIATAPKSPCIDIVAVAHERFGELKTFVQSWINQTCSNWRLTVLHDGFSEEFNVIMNEFQKISPVNVNFACTDQRFNDYGHTLRDLGIQKAIGDFILLTNADNYFIPQAIELMNAKLLEEPESVDILLFDMIHSHENPGGRDLPAYSYFDVKAERGSIDVSSAIVKSDLARKVGFQDKSHDGDASYFEDLLALQQAEPLNIAKVHSVLFVHN